MELLAEVAETERKKYRLQAKQLFLTFPQCLTEKEVVLTRIRRYFKEDLIFAVVAQEEHKNNAGKHLHAVIKLKTKFTSRDPHCLDILAGKHGDYASCRNISKAIIYITKEATYCSFGLNVDRFIQQVQQKKASGFAVAADKVVRGCGLKELNEIMPGFVLQHKRKLQDYISWIRLEQLKKPKLQWERISFMELRGEDREIALWLNKNIKQKRRFKQKQLYIYGLKNTGKSTLLLNLRKRLRCYEIPLNEDFYDFYADDEDLAYIDEFKGQKTIQWMNMWLQGLWMTLRQKGAQVIRSRNVPTIICSNYSPREVYHNVSDEKLETFLERLEVINVTRFIEIYKK